jgi:hypothetical protein
MPNRVRTLTIPDAERAELERRTRDRGAPARVAERARIVLLAGDGLTGPQIAERAGCSEPTVIKWRRQYAEDGLAAPPGENALDKIMKNTWLMNNEPVHSYIGSINIPASETRAVHCGGNRPAGPAMADAAFK